MQMLVEAGTAAFLPDEIGIATNSRSKCNGCG